MNEPPCVVDVLCVGHAAYDLLFSVDHHPAADEKTTADDLIACGGGPAANAAVMCARLGLRAAFAGYLGNDLYGEAHWQELVRENVITRWIVRGTQPTPLSAILVKPDGQRALVNYKGATQALPENAVDFSDVQPRVLLFDGHEPELSRPLARRARLEHVPTVLDAGSLHRGTQALMTEVDYLVASEKFALQYAATVESALARLADIAPVVVITLGERGLLWRRGAESGALGAFPVQAIDTTGAGDAFHGAFAAALALQLNWSATLRYASAAGALCCTVLGARPGLPDRAAHEALWQQLF